MSDTSSPPKPRRWLTYSLRSLLLLMVIAGIGFSWLGWKIKEARHQALAVAAIEGMGGFVTYDWASQYGHYPQTISGRLAPPSFPPPWLRNLFGGDFFDEVAGVSTGVSNPATDSTCSKIAELKDIQHVRLYGNENLTDKGLRYLMELPNLETLDIRGSAISDEGIKTIRQMTTLRTLAIIDSPITDESVPILCQMDYLINLALAETKLSKDGELAVRNAIAKRRRRASAESK